MNRDSREIASKEIRPRKAFVSFQSVIIVQQNCGESADQNYRFGGRCQDYPLVSVLPIKLTLKFIESLKLGQFHPRSNSLGFL